MSELPSGDVCVRDLTKRYGSIEAVRGVSFDARAGEIFGLLGPNGAGKTSTLECLLGLRRADAGTVAIGGIDVLTEPARIKEFIGAQLQTAALQDKIKVREALGLVGSFYSAPVAVDVLLQRFSLTEKADASFDSLSGGQKQRLLLALAFVNNPRVIVLDEPTAGLDPQSRRKLHRLISELRAEGRTVLLSTHLIDEAQQLCDRIGILHQGRMVAVAPPEELIAQARAVSRITVQTAKPIDRTMVLALPGATAVFTSANGAMLDSNDVSRTITALIEQLARDDNTLLDLQIRRPTLEDVFIELTGSAWKDAPEHENPARLQISDATK